MSCGWREDSASPATAGIRTQHSIEPVRQSGVDDVALVAEALLFHDALRGAVGGQGVADDLGEAEVREANPQHGGGHFAGKAASPVVREGGVEELGARCVAVPGWLQAAVADEASGGAVAEKPETVTIALPALQLARKPAPGLLLG